MGSCSEGLDCVIWDSLRDFTAATVQPIDTYSSIQHAPRRSLTLPTPNERLFYRLGGLSGWITFLWFAERQSLCWAALPRGRG